MVKKITIDGPNHALQRTRREHRGCNRCSLPSLAHAWAVVPCAGLLSLGRYILAIVLTSRVLCLADGAATNSTEPEAVQREKLFQRFIAEMDKARIIAATNNLTNRDAEFTNRLRYAFNSAIVHPSFGLHWDEVPGPTLTDSNAMAAVQAYIATNGWNMETNPSDIMDWSMRLKPIHGLPWEAIKDREFSAVTHGGVLYVLLKNWHNNMSGVAYNPNTNAFAPAITGFKPIGQHWYAWAQPENPRVPITLMQKYEGQKP